MSAETSEGRVSIGKLILIPAIITLAVTLLRLVGELQHWNSKLFNPVAGGPGAIVGIVWLVPIFGIYFAVKLCGAGAGPKKVSQVFLHVLLAIAVIVVVALIALKLLKLQGDGPGFLLALAVGAVVGIFVMAKPWPALFKTLLAYGYAARVPVAIVMLLAIKGEWGTHYDAAPPNFPSMHWLLKWLLIGAVPQLIFPWIWFTVLAGSLFGAVAAALTRRSKVGEHATAAS